MFFFQSKLFSNHLVSILFLNTEKKQVASCINTAVEMILKCYERKNEIFAENKAIYLLIRRQLRHHNATVIGTEGVAR